VPLSIQVLMFALLLELGLADLKYRVVPAGEVFFFGAVLLALVYRRESPLYLIAVSLSVAYGMLLVPARLALPLLIWPPVWPALFIGYGVRKELLGRGDLLAMAGISALYSFDVAIAALIGTALWIRLWSKKHREPGAPSLIPLLPGMACGAGIGMILHFLVEPHLPV